MLKKIGLTFSLLLLILVTQAQEELNFDKEIEQLNKLGKEMLEAKNDSLKFFTNEQYNVLLKKVIEQKEAFTYNFDALKTISILQAGELKIYNWALPKTNGTYQYFAFVTLNQKKNGYKVIELTDKSESIKSPENKTLTPKMWYGALYYKIIHHKKIGLNYYTFLGWDGNNLLTNKKIIDVIHVNFGTIKLGAPIFKTYGNRRVKRRIIFEYSDNAVMTLKFNQKHEKIIFDYLVPTSSKLKGIYEYYGPSLDTFDAYLLESRRWVFEKNTKIKLDRSVKDRIWNNPKDE